MYKKVLKHVKSIKINKKRVNKKNQWQVAVPDLQIREGPGHPDPEMRLGREKSKKKIFSALQASVWSNNKGGGGGGRGPSPGSATENSRVA